MAEGSCPLRLEGHAIVSADGMIADAAGAMPPLLRNEADWRQFQAALDGAALVILGRHGHLRHANTHGRRRLVLSSTVSGLEQRADAAWWNPAGLLWPMVLERLAIRSGTIAVTGGRQVFDCFATIGFDAFALAEVHDEVIAGGTPCFTQGHPRAVLASLGLTPHAVERLPGGGLVTLMHWRR